MNPLAWIAVGVVAGLAAALVLVRKGLFPGWLMRVDPGGKRRTGAEFLSDRPGAEADPPDAIRVRIDYEHLRQIRGDIQGLHVLRNDVQRVGDLLERVLEEAMGLQQHRALAGSPRPDPAAGRPAARPEPAREPRREPLREVARERPPEPGRGGVEEPPPTRRAAWPHDGRDDEFRVQHDETEGGFDPNPARPPALGDPAYNLPSIAPQRAPSHDAVFVEAKDDVIMPSERHPPEAWLERMGGDGEVWLNPRVPLTDPALQRWSTFFDWERREPGGRYQATRPARVSWSGSSGTVLSKGTARPL